MAFTFLAARGLAVGRVEARGRRRARRWPGGRWPTPASAAASSCCPRRRHRRARRGRRRRRRSSPPTRSPTGWMGLDIGPETTAAVRRAGSQAARTIFWNGPMGVFELAPFAARDARRRARGGRVGRRLGGRRRRLGRGGEPGRRRRSHHPRVDRRRGGARAGRGAHASRRRGARRGRGMSRRPFVAGNWKMHKTAAEAADFVARAGGARAGERRRRGVPAVHGAGGGGCARQRAFGSPSTPRTCTRRRAGRSPARCRPR